MVGLRPTDFLHVLVGQRCLTLWCTCLVAAVSHHTSPLFPFCGARGVWAGGYALAGWACASHNALLPASRKAAQRQGGRGIAEGGLAAPHRGLRPVLLVLATAWRAQSWRFGVGAPSALRVCRWRGVPQGKACPTLQRVFAFCQLGLRPGGGCAGCGGARVGIALSAGSRAPACPLSGVGISPPRRGRSVCSLGGCLLLFGCYASVFGRASPMALCLCVAWHAARVWLRALTSAREGVQGWEGWGSVFVSTEASLAFLCAHLLIAVVCRPLSSGSVWSGLPSRLCSGGAIRP